MGLSNIYNPEEGYDSTYNHNSGGSQQSTKSSEIGGGGDSE